MESFFVKGDSMKKRGVIATRVEGWRGGNTENKVNRPNATGTFLETLPRGEGDGKRGDETILWTCPGERESHVQEIAALAERETELPITEGRERRTLNGSKN